jgi:hypothetical protein
VRKSISEQRPRLTEAEADELFLSQRWQGKSCGGVQKQLRHRQTSAGSSGVLRDRRLDGLHSAARSASLIIVSHTKTRLIVS